MLVVMVQATAERKQVATDNRPVVITLDTHKPTDMRAMVVSQVPLQVALILIQMFVQEIGTAQAVVTTTMHPVSNAGNVGPTKARVAMWQLPLGVRYLFLPAHKVGG